MPNTSVRKHPWSLFTHFGRALLLLAMAACCRAAWSAGPQKHEPAPHPKTLSRDFRLALWVSKPTEELRLAAASLKLPVDWRTTPGDGLSWAAIVPARNTTVRSVGSSPRQRVQRRLRGSSPCVGRANPCGKVATEWSTDCTMQAGIAGGGCEEPRSGPPAASGRAQTLFRPAGNLPIPDHLESAAADRRHVHHRAMEDSSPANVRSTSTISTSISGRTNTTIPIIRKPTGNKAVYDRMRKRAYAHRLGIRTGVYIFPCQVPPAFIRPILKPGRRGHKLPRNQHVSQPSLGDDRRLRHLPAAVLRVGCG